MSFIELQEQIYNLKQTDLEMMTIKLDQKAKRIGFFQLSAEDRFLDEEVTCVARLLAILAKFGIYDKYLTKGLELYCRKESLSREQRKIIDKVTKRLQ